MAGKIPVQDEPQVAPRPATPAYFNPSASPEAFGAGIGAAVEKFGEIGGQIAHKERIIAAEATADDHDLKFAQDAGAVMADFRKQHGEAALDSKPVIDQISKLREQYGDLSDPLAQRLYHSASRRRAENLVQMVEAHSANERVNYYASTVQGLRDDSLQQIRDSYDSPEKISKAMEEYIPKQTTFIREVKGLSSGQASQEAQKYVKEGITQALGQAVAAQSPEAVQAGMTLINSSLTLGGQEYSVRSALGKDTEIWIKRLQASHAVESGKEVGASAFLRNYDPALRKVRDNQVAMNEIYAAFSTKDADGKVSVTNPDGLMHAIAAYKDLAGTQQQVNDAHTGTQVGTLLSMINSGQPLVAVKSTPEWKALLDTEYPNRLAAYYEQKHNLEDPNAKHERKAKTRAEAEALAEFYDQSKDRYMGPDGSALFVNDWFGKMHPTDFSREQVRWGATSKSDPPWLKQQINIATAQLLEKMDKKGPPVGKFAAEYNDFELKAYLDMQEGMRDFFRSYAEQNKGQMPPKDQILKEMDKYIGPVVTKGAGFGGIFSGQPIFDKSEPAAVARAKGGGPAPAKAVEVDGGLIGQPPGTKWIQTGPGKYKRTK